MPPPEQTTAPAYVLLGNGPIAWMLAIATTAAVLIGLLVVKSLVLTRLGRYAHATNTILGEVASTVLSRVQSLFLLAIAVFAGSRFLDLPPRADHYLTVAIIVLVVMQVAVWGHYLIVLSIDLYVRRRRATEGGDIDGSLATSLAAIKLMSLLALYLILLLLAADNMGINVKSVLTGLGIGGVAIALATQSILSDLFSSLSIVLDRPFVLGDFIVVGDKMGTVERIGLKTTRLRSSTGEQLVFSNSDLLSSRIQNFKLRPERRAAFSIGLSYDTPLEKLERIPAMIREIIQRHEKARFDHSHLINLGDANVEFETVYYVASADYNVHADILQAVLLEIYRRFDAEGIEFSFATRAVPVQPPRTGADLIGAPDAR